MARPKNSIPTPTLHKPSGQARVRIAGKDFYLGPFGSAKATQAYGRLIADLGAGKLPEAAAIDCRTPEGNGSGLSVAELFLAYQRHAESYYRKNGEPTSELGLVQDAVRKVRRLYGPTPVAEFGPLKLKAVRQELVGRGWARSTVNAHVRRIKRAFRWGVENELVPPSVYHGLQAVAGLRRGRTEAKEPGPVLPVAEATVNAVLPHVSKPVADMIRLQLLCGCRPGEICMLRPCDVNRHGSVWEFVPESHKTEHHGRRRLIFFGPRAQAILTEYLDDRPADAYCFSPAEAEAGRRAEMHAARKTPASYGNRPGTNRKPSPKWRPADRYTATSYRAAIRRGCELAFEMPDELRRIGKGLPKAEKERLRAAAAAWRAEHCWSPNRLRHSRGTALRRAYGLEASQVVLGHATADVTQIYAERDLDTARRIMAEAG